MILVPLTIINPIEPKTTVKIVISNNGITGVFEKSNISANNVQYPPIRIITTIIETIISFQFIIPLQKFYVWLEFLPYS